MRPRCREALWAFFRVDGVIVEWNGFIGNFLIKLLFELHKMENKMAKWNKKCRFEKNIAKIMCL